MGGGGGGGGGVNYAMGRVKRLEEKWERKVGDAKADVERRIGKRRRIIGWGKGEKRRGEEGGG